MYNFNEADKKARRKVIGITTAIVVVILALVVAIIVVATNKSNNTVEEGAAFTLDEKPAEADKAATTIVESPVSEGVSVGSTVINATPATTETTDTVASTGPEDLLPLALSAGAATTAGLAFILNKR